MSKSIKLLTALAVLEATSQKKDDVFMIENPYADLPDLSYSGGHAKASKHKSNLSKKQKKTRSASKRAKQARKNGRKK